MADSNATMAPGSSPKGPEGKEAYVSHLKLEGCGVLKATQRVEGLGRFLLRKRDGNISTAVVLDL